MDRPSDDLIELCQPALEAGDVNELAATLRRHSSIRQLCTMLREKSVSARRIAALGLSLIADAPCSGCLARALRDEDDQVADLAENGLWSLWFRGGLPEAMAPFQQGVALLGRDKPLEAIEAFAKAHELDPEFAEAHNQRAICHYMLEQYELSIHHCELTLARVKHHFGALSGIGHCYANLGLYEEAIVSYRKALEVHPRLNAVAATIPRLEQLIKRRLDSSDAYDALIA